jgi:hypothetical protein
MATTPVYGWETPDDTDYVYQGASAARTTANAIDSTLASQVSTLNASIAALPQGVKAYIRSTTEYITPTTTETVFMTTNTPFTPVAGRLYEIVVTIGNLYKTNTTGDITMRLRKNSVSGTVLNTYWVSGDVVVSDFIGTTYTFSKIFTSTQLGTTSFTPYFTAASNAGGCVLENNVTSNGCIIVKDIGLA